MEDLAGSLCFLFCCLAVCLAAVLVMKELTMGIYTGSTRLDGKLAVITGANCGIGLETARDLAARGATVILGCRSRQRGEAAVREVIGSSGNTGVEMVELDLMRLESVRRFAQHVAARAEPLHILINNAGIVDVSGSQSWGSGRSQLSDDGLEMVTQTNHLSHFLLTNLLRERLQAAGKSRVINVSSTTACQGNIDLANVNYEKDSSVRALASKYHNSKLMNVLFTKELSRRWAELGVTSYSLHPGIVRTPALYAFCQSYPNIFTIVFSYLAGKTPWQGAQTSIFLACERNIEDQTGSFFGDCRNWDFLLPSQARDPRLAVRLWERSAQLVQLDMSALVLN